MLPRCSFDFYDPLRNMNLIYVMEFDDDLYVV